MSLDQSFAIKAGPPADSCAQSAAPAGGGDAIGGLRGRAAVHARLSGECERLSHGAAPLGLLLVDVDMLRSVNDTLGRGAGDAFLAQLGARLIAAAGDDGFAARIDGDEFALILPGIGDAEALARWGRRVLDIVRATRGDPRSEVSLSASIGAALAPADAATASSLMHCADVAQFCAKSSGRDRALPYKPSLRTQIDASVRACLAAKNFSLQYQPIVTTGGARALTGLESFLRWHHPTRGLLFPGDFRPVLEDRRSALTVGAFVLDEATRQMRRWLDQGFDFGRVAVNVSAAQLRAPGFAGDLLAQLAHGKVPAARLALEVPEDVYLADDIALIDTALRRLRDAGVALFVDGWARDGASLDTLARLPVLGLKLDRGLTQDAAIEPLAALMASAQALDMTVIAEGVETADQLARLRAIGCRQAQGYLIARPMPAARVPAFASRLEPSGQLGAAG